MNWLLAACLAALIALAVRRLLRCMRRGGGCCGEHGEDVRRRTVRDRNPAHYPYAATAEIGGMTCDNCAARVENALNALPGTWARVDLGRHSARIRCQEQPDLRKLRETVSLAGYAVLRIWDSAPTSKAERKGQEGELR